MSSSEMNVRAQLHDLYAENHPWLIARLRSRLGCSQQAADFAQDTFVRILTGCQVQHRFPEIRDPHSYLATIANRVLVDHFRRNALEAAYLEALAQQPELFEISPEERLLQLECLYEIDAMLTGLGANVKRAFLLSQLQGQPYAKIATEINVSVSSVKKYMAKATAHCLKFMLRNKT